MINVLEMMNAEQVRTERYFARQGELAEKEARFEFTQVPQQSGLAKIGPHEITDQDLLGTRTKVLWQLILKRRKLRGERRAAERAQSGQ